MSDQPNLDGYIAGFFDGEGLIKVNIKKRKYIEIHPVIRITQNAKSGDVFEIIKKHLKSRGILSSIYIEKRDGMREDIAKINITGWLNVKTFLEIIYPHTIVKKPQVKIMLEEIMPRLKPLSWRYYKYGKYSKSKTLEIMHWIDKMNALKGQRGTSGTKYTEQYFRDLWGITD